MVKVAPFHSIDPNAPDVYHVCSNCDRGRAILPRNKKFGTGGGRMCWRCRDLIDDWGC